MAYTYKPKQPPPLDTSGFLRRIREIAEKVGLGPFPVFGDGLVTFHRWLRSELEFDGAEAGGLRDVVNANAYAVDELKEDFDQHRTTDNVRHNALVQRVAALEGQQADPFPGSG